MINSGITVERECKIETAEELHITPRLNKIRHYTSNWIRRANRKPRNSLQSAMESCAPETRTKPGKTTEETFGCWDWNRSTGGPMMMAGNVNEGKMWRVEWREWWLETEVRKETAGTESCCRELWIVNLSPVGRNEELSDLYSLPSIVRVVKSIRMRWAGHVARMGEGRDVHRVLMGKREGKRPMGRPRRRWEDNVKMDLREVWGRCGWGQGQVAGTCEYGEELSSFKNAGNFLTSRRTS
jgi:hypothetical protein